MIRLLPIAIFVFPLFLSADTIVVKTKAPQNKNAVFQYRVTKGYDKNRREMSRVLVIFGGRNTDGKADASGASLGSLDRSLLGKAWQNL